MNAESISTENSKVKKLREGIDDNFLNEESHKNPENIKVKKLSGPLKVPKLSIDLINTPLQFEKIPLNPDDEEKEEPSPNNKSPKKLSPEKKNSKPRKLSICQYSNSEAQDFRVKEAISLTKKTSNYEEQDTITVKSKADGKNLGTKEDPYTSLKEVRAHPNWRILHVSYSEYPLEGGLVLKDGQSIIGHLYRNSKYPVITNTSRTIQGSRKIKKEEINTNQNNSGQNNSGQNNSGQNTDNDYVFNSLETSGNGIFVESGTVSIKNIEFKNTNASAIEYSNASNITIVNVKITNCNTKHILYSKPYIFNPIVAVSSTPRSTPREENQKHNILYHPITRIYSCRNNLVGALHSININNGTTTICGLYTDNNFTGPVINEIALNSAKRDVLISDSTFKNITNNTPDNSFLNNTCGAINILSEGASTLIKAEILGNKFEDFSSVSILNGINVISIASLNIGSVIAKVDRCQFKDVSSDSQGDDKILYNSISVLSDTIFTNDHNSMAKSKNELLVSNCKFEESKNHKGFKHHNYANCNAIILSNNNSSSILSCFKNEMYIPETAVKSIEIGNCTSEIMMENNLINSYNGCFLELVSGSFNKGTKEIKKNKINNTYVYNNQVTAFTGLSLIGNINYSDSSSHEIWSRIDVELENNIFNSSTDNIIVGSRMFEVLDLKSYLKSGMVSENITITASKNNIVGFIFNIIDTSPINPFKDGYSLHPSFNLSENYWSPEPSFGNDPFIDNVLVFGKGVFDIDNPLSRSISFSNSSPLNSPRYIIESGNSSPKSPKIVSAREVRSPYSPRNLMKLFRKSRDVSRIFDRFQRIYFQL